jgi:alkanesulfonate monooxygenase SsuD/methylene tetrahydromethanopterin reductase-like flavin-dependent oxidoreductase (luciferase family)
VSLGCLVSSVSYRHPALLVKMATALDHDSGGRATLGIGAGWHATEHDAYGYAFPTLSERLDRLEEAAAVCRAMLDDTPTHVEGRWVTARGLINEPPPVRGRLPLLIGGSGERRTLPIVARHADAWNGEGDPESFARKSRRLDELCIELGRDPGTVRRTVGLPPPLIRADRAAACAALADLLVRHGLGREAAMVAAGSSALVGSAEQVAARLLEYRVAGAQEAIFDWPTPGDPETLEALAGPVRAILIG